MLLIGPREATDETVSGFLRRLDPLVSHEPFGDAIDLQVVGQLVNDQGGTICTVTGTAGRASFEAMLLSAQSVDLRELEGAK